MGSRSQRRKRRTEAQARTERKFLFFNWRDDWGRPPRTYWWFLWLLHAPLILMGVIGTVALTVGGVALLFSDLATSLGALAGAGLAALATYWFAVRPLWRFHRYCQAFGPGGKLSSQFQDDEDQTGAAPSNNLKLDLFPGTPQFRAAVEECVAAIDREHQIRRASQGEFRSAAALLHQIVEPAEQGQVDLKEAYQVRADGLELVYGIVTYEDAIREGRRLSQITGVGQVVFLELPVDLRRVWIRPEGLMDKLGEFVFSRDIDFSEHPRFSRRYLLHSECRDTLERQVPDEFWQAFGEHVRLVAVGKGSSLIVGCEGGIDPDDAAALAALGFRLLRAFGASR